MSDTRDGFFKFLEKIERGEIQTPQLFLMGDMFDLLVGKVIHTIQKQKRYIELLEKIALHVEVFYFEGNHDFVLEKIFTNVKVIPIENQPMIFELQNGQKALLSHGDKYGGFLHDMYTRLIRSKTLLGFLNYIDERVEYKISKKIETGLLHKKLCLKIANFEEIIQSKLQRYKTDGVDFVLEGHYHQNKAFELNKIKYINFSSFACNQSYFIVEFFNDAKFAEKN